MSFFLATVPKGTQFYHGTSSASRVNGTEWLAFEPEHALNFARVGPPPGGPPGGPPPEGPHGGPPPPLGHFDFRIKQDIFADNNQQQQQEEEEYGYLHTYATAKNLRLLYIDGLSAGKTDMGTLDSTDRILLRDRLNTSVGVDEEKPDRSKRPRGGPPGDVQRAHQACSIARDQWNDRIDGFIRAEAGFEIILCDFKRDLDLVRISAVQRENPTNDRPGRGGGFGSVSYFYRSIASRFNGIGGGRVKLNYEHFVTAYAYTDLNLFAKDESSAADGMPRLKHIDSEALEPFRADLTRLVMDYDAVETARESFDWQSIVDMVVLKYSDFLAYLASDEVDSLAGLQSNVSTVFQAFIDDRERDAVVESRRCADQFLPASVNDSPSLAGRVVFDVSYTICSTLRAVLDDTEYDTSKARVRGLVEYLNWTTWKECKEKCGYNEVCYIPIWPFGTVEDRENPQCKSQNGNGGGGRDSEGYWRGGHGPGGPRDGEHEEL